MSLRSYILLMFIATIACYLGVMAVIFFYDPFAGGIGALMLFYLSLFLAALGTFAIVGLIARLILTHDKIVFKMVIISVRQAIWLALLLIICLHLKHLNLLAWKTIIFVIIAFSLLELFFISYKSKHSLKI